jgi:two-component system sensor histidine kinase/response regulator
MKELVILCVDDEDMVLRSLQRELNHTLGNKYLVETANSGKDALEMFAELQNEGHEIPVVIADHIMPEMKGAELLQKIHEIAPETLKIMLTGQADMKAVIHAVNTANLYRYMAKPWERTDLALTVKEAIRRYVQEKKLKKQNAILKNVKQVLETKVKERTAQLEVQQIELQRLNASKDKFFSIIARDLRSPFTGLLDMTNSIVKNIGQFSQEEIKEHVASLRDSAETVHDLIENLLAWSQLQQGMAEYHPAQISLTQLVEENKLVFASNATEKRLTLKNQVPKEIVAYADQLMLDMIIRNLISNAMKFSYPGGIITIVAHQNGSVIELMVSDRGIGIEEEDLPKLFHIDRKLVTEGTAGEKGTGLGLVVSKALIEKHGGEILIESEVGRGTTCTLRLPAQSTVTS